MKTSEAPRRAGLALIKRPPPGTSLHTHTPKVALLFCRSCQFGGGFVIDIPPTGFGPVVSRTVREGDRVRVMVRLPAPLVRDLAVLTGDVDQS